MEIQLKITDAAKALEIIHERGFVHGDIKPLNLFVKNNKLIIGDFGSAIRIDGNPKKIKFTGTPPYASPKLLENWTKNSNPYTKDDDRWSLGCCMLEIETLIPVITAQLIPHDYSVRHPLSTAIRLQEQCQRFINSPNKFNCVTNEYTKAIIKQHLSLD